MLLLLSLSSLFLSIFIDGVYTTVTNDNVVVIVVVSVVNVVVSVVNVGLNITYTWLSEFSILMFIFVGPYPSLVLLSMP